MKIPLVIALVALTFVPIEMVSQTDSQIAKVYIKRAEEKFYNLEFDKSLEIFKKAQNYMDSVPDARVAKLGALLFYEHKKYVEARDFAKLYFVFERNKSAEDYDVMLETYVNIQEEIDQLVEEQKAIQLKQKQDALNLKRLDSLNALWIEKSEPYKLDIDSTFSFNKYGLALFQKNGKVGIINDVGRVIEKPSEYTDFLSYDGYILLLNSRENATKIYAYSCENRTGFLLPSVSSFNALSTHYGKVLSPRANGVFVSYPNHSNKAYVYNLRLKEFPKQVPQKDFLKTLKRNDIIERYNDNQVRINKQWLTLGNHLGAKVYELYLDKKLFGFINTSKGILWDAAYYNYFGGFCNGNFEILEGDKRFWIDLDGLRQDSNVNENGTYKGTSRFVKLDQGTYIIIQNRADKDYLILEDKALLNQVDFVHEAPK